MEAAAAIFEGKFDDAVDDGDVDGDVEMTGPGPLSGNGMQKRKAQSVISFPAHLVLCSLTLFS